MHFGAPLEFGALTGGYIGNENSMREIGIE